MTMVMKARGSMVMLLQTYLNLTCKFAIRQLFVCWTGLPIQNILQVSHLLSTHGVNRVRTSLSDLRV